MTDEELKQLVASLAISQAETNKEIKALQISQAKTDKQMKETDRKLKSLGIQFGSFTKNQADIIEELFYNSLIQKKKIGGLQFDRVARNVYNDLGAIENEYDLVFYNGSEIGILEVKSKAHVNDLKKFPKKIKDFRVLFPMYENYAIYMGIASLHTNKEVLEMCQDFGYMVLKLSGELLEDKTTILKSY